MTNSLWVLPFLGLLAWSACAMRRDYEGAANSGLMDIMINGHDAATQRMDGTVQDANAQPWKDKIISGTKKFGKFIANGTSDLITGTKKLIAGKSKSQMPVGCPTQYGLGLCEMTLLQNACVAKHPQNSKGMTAENACDKVWPRRKLTTGDGREPLNLYCLAAASDDTLLKKASELTAHVPSDPALCQVKTMDHLQNTSAGAMGQLGDMKLGGAADRIRRAEKDGLLKQSSHGGGMNLHNSQKLTEEIRKICEDHVRNGPLESQLAYGFCDSKHKAVPSLNPDDDKDQGSWDPQDCEFYKAVKAAWGRSKSYGKENCNAFVKAKKFRCLALRKHVLQIAQDESVMKVAAQVAFDKMARTRPFDKLFRNCREKGSNEQSLSNAGTPDHGFDHPPSDLD